MPRPSHLPNYKAPPIDEVVVGLQFEPIVRFSEPHVGLFWQRVRDDYPTVESHPRLEGPIEDLQERLSPTPPTVFFGLGGSAQGRTWLISSDESLLIQVQNTRFILNWRRRGQTDYPHFDAILERFWSAFDRFRSMLNEEHLQLPSVQQLEVTYINWITTLGISDFFRPASASSLTAPGVSPMPEDQAFMARHMVRDTAGTPIARLYLQCQSALRIEPEGATNGTQFTLTFKSPSTSFTDEEVNSRAAIARESIVQSFTDLTTDAAHVKWERTQ